LKKKHYFSYFERGSDFPSYFTWLIVDFGSGSGHFPDSLNQERFLSLKHRW